MPPPVSVSTSPIHQPVQLINMGVGKFFRFVKVCQHYKYAENRGKMTDLVYKYRLYFGILFLHVGQAAAVMLYLYGANIACDARF